MKILLTGGGSGGHFYPIIAVAQSINDEVRKNHLVEPKLFYIAPEPYNKGLLFDNKITFKRNPAGKFRRYFSLMNLFDIFKTGIGVIKAVWTVFLIYPDVVFGKGGYGSFPALLAAKILRIPVIIHESDSTPGKTNIWAGKFARRVAVSYQEAASYFPKEKVAYTGNPIRKEVKNIKTEGAKEFLKLEEGIPTILILGGSLGSQKINDIVVEALPKFVEQFQIIHQTGKKNYSEIVGRSNAILFRNENRNRYHPFDYLNNIALKMATSEADLIISRAGSTIFEIAYWGKPSIIIPISDSNGNHQAKNSFAYSRSGAAVVIDEKNLSDSMLYSQSVEILNNEEKRKKMSEAAKGFAKEDASEVIAKEIIKIALEHEK